MLFLQICSAFRLIGIGMGTWALATFGCGLAVGFKSLIFCRMLVGVGEASFVALAAPFIGERYSNTSSTAVRLAAAMWRWQHSS